MKISEELDSAIDEMRGKTTRTPVYILLLELKALRDSAAVLVKSLEFYGDRSKFEMGRIHDSDIEPAKKSYGSVIYHVDNPPREVTTICGGKRARQALAEYRKDWE